MSRSIYLNKIVPDDMRQHLMLKKHSIDIFDVNAEEIRAFCEAVGEFNREAKVQPGFEAPGECGDEKGKRKGNTKSQGQMHKGHG